MTGADEALVAERLVVALSDRPMLVRVRDALVGPLYRRAELWAGCYCAHDCGCGVADDLCAGVGPRRARLLASLALRLDVAGAAALTRRARRRLAARGVSA